MREIEAIKERGIYDIDIVEGNKELGGLTIDTNRRQYYIVIPQLFDLKAIEFLRENILNLIAEKKNQGELVGNIKSYAEEILDKKLAELGVFPITAEEDYQNRNFEKMLNNYQKSSGMDAEIEINKHCFK